MNYITLAFWELALLSILSGVVGTLIVLRKQSFFAVALSHATFPGGVIAAILGLNVLLGQAIAAIVLAGLMALLALVPKQTASTATGIVLTFGFALGALLASLQTGFKVPIDALLIGSIFGVKTTDIAATTVVMITCFVAVSIGYRKLVLHTFDAVAFNAYGYNRLVPEIISAVCVASAVVVAMPAVGAILAVALIVGPAATAQLLVRDFRLMAPVAVVFALVASILGLWLSWNFGVAAGGAIGLVVAAEFLLVLLVRKLFIRS